jgi:hypothetical protein
VWKPHRDGALEYVEALLKSSSEVKSSVSKITAPFVS